MTHAINDQLVHLKCDVSLLIEDSKNARVHSKKNVQAIADSLKHHGQRKPLIVQRRGNELVVRAGNGTLRAARSLGWTEVAALIVDEDDQEAIQFAIRDNRTAELAEWDKDSLTDLLASVADTSELESMGWTPEELGLVDGVAPTGIDPDEVRFEVMITARNEEEQMQVIQMCQDRNLQFRALS